MQCFDWSISPVLSSLGRKFALGLEILTTLQHQVKNETEIINLAIESLIVISSFILG